MNFSEDVKEKIKTLIRDDFYVEGASQIKRWDDKYHRMGDSSSWATPKRGRFGTVYQLYDLKTTEVVAVKEIKLDFKTDFNTPGLSRQSRSVKNDTAATMDFLMACQESVLQSSGKFRHPNIVQCYDSWIEQREVRGSRQHLDPNKLIDFIDDEQELTTEIRKNLDLVKGMKFFIVMELYDQNLEERYSATSPSRDETIYTIHQIALALQFIHAKGYVHRDLKPRNIFITDSKVALGDFGLCKRVEERELVRGTTGTHPYNTATDAYLTPKVDIWALGIIIFELFFLSETDPRPSADQLDKGLSNLVETARQGDQIKLKKFVGLKVKRDTMKKLVVKCLQLVDNRPTAEEILQASCFAKIKVKSEPRTRKFSELVPTVVESASLELSSTSDQSTSKMEVETSESECMVESMDES